MQKQVWNINKILAWAIDYFKAKEIPEPRLSAELLLSAVLDLSRMDLYLKYDLELNEIQLKAYKEFILRRLNHEPIQYITGEAYFRKIKLCVDKSVLIPRAETELLVERAKKAIIHIAELKKFSGSSIKVLEIGTGSGAIAISLLFETDIKQDNLFTVDIAATDISGDALKTAQENAGRILSSEKMDHLEFFKCDVIPQGNEDFENKYLKNIDLVISNPPYIAEADYKNLERQVKDYEPEGALNAGETGTEAYSHIIKKVKPFLNPESSYIIFETDPLASPGLQKIIKAEFKDSDIATQKDYNGKDRIISAFISSRAKE